MLTRLASRFGYPRQCTVPLFEVVWGADFDINFPGNTEQICAIPGGATLFGGSATPIQLSAHDRTKANNIFDVEIRRLPEGGGHFDGK